MFSPLGGVRAKALVPVFPSDTLPSHYSMLTGLHPEHHGIIGNTMIDPSIPGTFAIGIREVVQNPKWWLGEPIWITAQKQGLRAATCFWPGTDVQIGGTRPTYWLPFDASLPNEKRVAQIIDWLSLPKETRPQFLTLYLGDVDSARNSSAEVGMGYDWEYWAWDSDAREVFEERIAILSDGGRVTPTMDWIARVEARKVNVRTLARRASEQGSVSFALGRF